MTRKPFLLVIACLVASACGNTTVVEPQANTVESGSAALKKAYAKHRNYRIHHNEKRLTTVAGEAYLLDQDLTISVPGRAAHDLKVKLKKSITKGGEDVAVQIDDLTTNTTTTFAYSEEDGSSLISFGGHSVPMVVNPNRTITIADATHTTVADAAHALATHPGLAGIDPQTLGGLQEVLVDSIDMGTDSRWSIVVNIVISYIIYVVCDWTCNVIFEDGSRHEGTCRNLCGEVLSGMVEY